MPRQTTKKPAGEPAAAKTVIRATTKKPPALTTPTEEQIRARAYQIFLTRNGGQGDAHSDWSQAERELVRELNR